MKPSDLVPPILFRALLRHWPRHGMFGDYPSWEAACAAAPRYSTNIQDSIQRTERLRDGAIWANSMPVLAGLQLAAPSPRVLDFGGGLGSAYFAVRRLVPDIAAWRVVDRPEIVDVGANCFADEKLRFYASITDAVVDCRPTLTILASVLQYLSDPYAILSEIVALRPRAIVVDRLPLSGTERFMVQKVPPECGTARYPIRVLDENRFQNCLSDYKLAAQQDLGRIDPTLLNVAYVARIYASRNNA